MQVVDTLPFVSVLQHFARGMAYSRQGNLVMAKRELNAINKRIEDKTLKIILDNFNSPYETCNVARLILKGAISEEQKQYDTAIGYYTKAVEAEDKLIYNEPRDWQVPARQYLGNLLIKTGKYNQAIAVLNKDLVINPNNGWSLTGLQQAYQYTNNITALKSVKLQLKNAWKIKDMNIQAAAF
jgi:tetratricopeptide (TPR) repeat protein